MKILRHGVVGSIVALGGLVLAACSSGGGPAEANGQDVGALPKCEDPLDCRTPTSSTCDQVSLPHGSVPRQSNYTCSESFNLNFFLDMLAGYGCAEPGSSQGTGNLAKATAHSGADGWWMVTTCPDAYANDIASLAAAYHNVDPVHSAVTSSSGFYGWSLHNECVTIPRVSGMSVVLEFDPLCPDCFQ